MLKVVSTELAARLKQEASASTSGSAEAGLAHSLLDFCVDAGFWLGKSAQPGSPDFNFASWLIALGTPTPFLFFFFVHSVFLLSSRS